MQEITEQQDVAQEISEAFSQRTGLGEDFDEVGSVCEGWSVWLLGRAALTIHSRRGALNTSLSLIKE